MRKRNKESLTTTVSKELDYHKLKHVIRDKVIKSVDMSQYIDDSEFRSIISHVVMQEDVGIYDISTKEQLINEIFNSVRRLGPIQELLDGDDDISEIMINGYNAIFYEKNGRIHRYEKAFESKEILDDIIQRMVSAVNRSVNEANPIVDARLQDGSRINVVLPPISLCGPIVTIRRFMKNKISLDGMVARGSISEDAARLLKKLVQARYNIFISGGTGAGKTTFLNALSAYIPSDERIITIEDAAELQINTIPNIVRLEVRNGNQDGTREISIRDLIKSALRMRPDRIIVGEVRDGAALDLMNAYNTGHDGSISSGHANSAKDMISRLESMIYMAAELPVPVIRSKIESGIDILVHLGRLQDKSRSVLEIAEITGIIDGEIQMNMLYEYQQEEKNISCGKGLIQTANRLVNVDKLIKAGLYNEEEI